MKKYAWLFSVSFVVLVVDQLAKIWAHARLLRDRIIFEGDFLQLGYAENRAAALGLFSNVPENFRVPLFHFVSFGAVVLVLYYASRLSGAANELFVKWGLPLVLGGALGNEVDRLFRGYVIDFIDFHPGGWQWPAFNVADAAIVTGMVLLIVDSMIRPAKR